MKKTHNPDYLLYGAGLVATLFGIIAVWDAGYAESAANGEMFPRAILTQAIFGMAGIFLAFTLSRVNPQTLKRYAYPIVGGTILLLIGVLLFGKDVNGATRWYRFGPFSFQPSEVAKLSAVLFIAAGFCKHTEWAEVKSKSIRNWIGNWLIPKMVRAWPILPVLVMVALIEMQPDLKTAMVIVATMFFMLLAAGISKKTIVTGLTVIIVVAGALIIDKPYRLTRLLSHGDRWSESKIDSIGFQTTQSETALAMGGAIGKGFGQGRAKYTLPEPTSDFVLATIGEEAGFVGSMLVIGILGLIVWRLYTQGMMRVDRFERLVLVGISCWIAVQTVANVVVANGAIPVMGVPLPFFSAGGSSLFALWLAIGVSQSIVCSPNVRVERGGSLETQVPTSRRRAYVR